MFRTDHTESQNKNIFRKTFMLFLLLFVCAVSWADATWNGSSDTNWSNLANWTGTLSGTITIPTGCDRYPVLTLTESVSYPDATLVIESGAEFTLNGTKTEDSLKLCNVENSGTLKLGIVSLLVTGDWTNSNSGSLEELSSLGWVEFAGDSGSVSKISGNTEWINFRCKVPGKKIIIEANSFQKIKYDFKVEGTDGNPVEICSSSPGSVFRLYVRIRNRFSCKYVRFSDCRSVTTDGSSDYDYAGVLGPGCIDVGNNSGLFAKTYIWTGSKSTDWTNPLNWNVPSGGSPVSTNSAPDPEDGDLTIKINGNVIWNLKLPAIVSVKELIVDSDGGIVIDTQRVSVEKVTNDGTVEIGNGGSLTTTDFINNGTLVLSAGTSLSVTGTKTNGANSEVRFKGAVEKLEDFVGLWGKDFEKISFDNLTYFEDLKNPSKLTFTSISPELAFDEMMVSGSLSGSEGLSLTIKSKGSGLKFKEIQISGLTVNESVSGTEGTEIVTSGTPVDKIAFANAAASQTFILKTNGHGSVLNLDFIIPGIGTVGSFDSRIFTEWLGTVDEKWGEDGNWTNGAPVAALTTYAIIKKNENNKYPVLSSGISFPNLNLTIEAGGKIDFNGNNVSLKSIVNSGTVRLTGAETITGSKMNNPDSTVEYNTASDLNSLCWGSEYENLKLSGIGTVLIDSPDHNSPISYVVKKTFAVSENANLNIGLTTLKAGKVSNAGTITINERHYGQDLKAIETGTLENSGTISVGDLTQIVSPSVNNGSMENKGLVEVAEKGQLHGYSEINNTETGTIHFASTGMFYCNTFENRGLFVSEAGTSFGGLTNGIRNYGTFELCGKEISLGDQGKPKYNEPGSKIIYTQKLTSKAMMTWGDNYANLVLTDGIELFSGWDKIKCSNRDFGFSVPSIDNHPVENLAIWKDKNFDVTVTTNSDDQTFKNLALRLESGKGKLSDFEISGASPSDPLSFNNSTGEVVFSSSASSHSFRLTVKDSTADDMKMTFSLKGFKEDTGKILSISYGHEMPSITQCHAVVGSDKLSVFFSIPVNGSSSEADKWAKAFRIKRGDVESPLQIDDSVRGVAIRQEADRNKVMGITFSLNGPVTLESLEKDSICVNPAVPEGVKSTDGVPLMLDQKHALSDFAAGAITVETAYANQSMTGPVRVFDGSTSDKVPAGSDISIKVDKGSDSASWDSGMELVMIFGTYAEKSSTWRSLVKGFYAEADIDDSSDNKSRVKYGEILTNLQKATEEDQILTVDDEDMIFASLDFCKTAGWTGGKKIQFVFAWKKSDGNLLTNADGNPLYCLALFGQDDVADPECDVWTFEIGQMKQQGQGVSILNNVLNLNRSDVATLNLTLERNGMVTVQVLTIDGDVVKTLQRGRLSEGSYDFDWDGKNAAGRTVARGMYFVRVVGPDIDQTRKIMVVR